MSERSYFCLDCGTDKQYINMKPGRMPFRCEEHRALRLLQLKESYKIKNKVQQ